MCLIFLAYQQRDDWPLVLVSNRDEFFQRPSLEGHFWGPQFNLLGGRDQEQGGSWLAVNRNGRLAAVTNYRDPKQPLGTKSRGLLVNEFVEGDQAPADYLAGLEMDAYTGFNLLLGDVDQLYYASNRDDQPQALGAGIYGLSNHLLDSPWPKVTGGKEIFTELMQSEEVDVERLFDLMTDHQIAPDEQLPQTGMGDQVERHLSSRFIPAWRNRELTNYSDYGTRTTTVVLMDRQGRGRWFERNHTTDAVNQDKTLAFTW